MRILPGRLPLTLGVVLAVLSLAACGGAESRLDDHMERGRSFLEAGNIEKARVEFGNALQIAPNDPDARYLSGVVAERLGKVRDAVAMYEVAIDARPEHALARASLGRVYVFGGAPERALEIVAPGLEKAPDDPDLLTVRGAARVQMQDLVGGLEDAKRAVALAPTNESAVALLASLYRRSGEIGQAIELVGTTVERLPASVDLRQVLGSLHLSAGDRAQAEVQLRKLIELRPKELGYRTQLAIFLLGGEDVDGAEATLREAVAALPDSEQAKLALVEFVTTRRSSERGEEVLQGFIAADPRAYDLQLGLGDLQRRAGDGARAASTYEAVIAKGGSAPQALGARNRLAAIAFEEGRFEDAAAQVEAVLALNSRDNDALLLRGSLALRQKDPAAAIADIRTVLRDQPGVPGILRTLARAHLANGEPALAEESLRAAIDAAPAALDARLELAQFLIQSRKADAAVPILEKLALENPDEPSVREGLVRSYLAVGDFEAARRGADDLLLLRPDLPVGAFLAGLAAQAEGRLADAGIQFERALAAQPGAVDVVAALSRLDVAQGRTEAAIERVAAVVAAEPKNAVTRNLHAELLLASGSFAKAAAEATEATKLAPAWPVPHRVLGVSRVGLGDTSGAIGAYEKGLEATSHDPMLGLELAILLEREGLIDRSAGVYEELLRRNPRLEIAANNLAMLLVTHRQDDASIARASALTEQFAGSSEAALLDTYGWVQLKVGKLDLALAALERASGIDPKSRTIRHHLAMAQLASGKTEEAEANLEIVTAAATPFAGMEEARAALALIRRRG